MNNVRSMVLAARASSDQGASLYSEPMLAELLALNEEMVEQLRLESMGPNGDSALLAGMIEQHENAAAMLRLQLANHRSGRISHGPSLTPAKIGDEVRGAAGANRPASVNGSKPAANGARVNGPKNPKVAPTVRRPRQKP